MLAGKVRDAVAAAESARTCAQNVLNPFRPCTDLRRRLDQARDRLVDLARYVAQNPVSKDRIFANMASRPGATDDSQELARDRAQGLFHPNVGGYAVQACDALAIFEGRTTDGCSTATAPPPDTVNRQPATRSPVAVAARQAVEVVLRGFEPLSRVRLRLFSDPVDLGEVTADAEGTIRSTVTVPAVGAGVHALEADGAAAGGTQLTKQVLLDVAGRPTGEYAVYLCCFTPEPAEIAPDAPNEQVVVTVGGIELGSYEPDETGGVLVHVPPLSRLTDPSALVVAGRSTTTGRTVQKTVSPIPATPSLWATDGTADALTVVGNGFRATGLVHSEGGVAILGSAVSLTGGTEYGGQLTVRGTQATIRPEARRVAAGQGAPRVSDIADYRPGGRVATSGVAYRAVPASACRNGSWTPGPTEALAGVVYVPCGVVLAGPRTLTVTLAAEGPVRLIGSNVTLTSPADGAPSIVSGATGDAVVVEGSGVRLSGAVHAARGTVRSTGVNSVLECGVVATRITVQGSGASAPMAARCLS